MPTEIDNHSPNRFTSSNSLPAARSGFGTERERIGGAAGQGSNPVRCKIVFVGHVDHGKSTLIGRIFYDTHSLPEGKVEQIRRACEAEGMEFEYAFLLDALLEEQEQNITIDTTQIPFRTARREYVIIDAPGHTEFLKNMVTGAASADAAILLIAANEGVREQSRRHGYLLSLLGIKQVVVVVNKMDTVDYRQDVFATLRDEAIAFLEPIGITPLAFLPVSARNGVNIVAPPAVEMPWWDGPTVLAALDGFQTAPQPTDQPLRLPIQDVYRFDERRILAGRIEAGTLRVGDTLLFSPEGKTTQIATIERWSAPTQSQAGAGESVGITLAEQIFVQRGSVASHVPDAPTTSRHFRANLFWMTDVPLIVGQKWKLRLTTQQVEAEVVAIERVLDASTLTFRDQNAESVIRNEVAEVILRTRPALVFDTHERQPTFGRFVLLDDKKIVAGGIVTGAVAGTSDAQAADVPNRNLVWNAGQLTPGERAGRNGHRGIVVWMTGLSGAGKSTLANGLERALFERDIAAYVLDGDNVRHGLNADLDFSPSGRAENIRRVAHVAQLMADAGLCVITAFISPFREDRDRARAIVEAAGGQFVEVFVDADLATCETRDPKGLYRKARNGEIADFTGLTSPYEPPLNADLTVHTDGQSASESVSALLDTLLMRLR